jgi:uncharacterized membrane protein YjjP (DUF1212 family)
MSSDLDAGASAPAGGDDVRPAPVSTHDVLQLALQGVAVLFANGETTEQTVAAGMRIAAAHGHRATVLPRWGELAVRIDGDPDALHDVVAVAPTGVDMNKVLEAERAVDAIGGHNLPAERAASTFRTIAATPPVSLGRFALAAAIGAAALGVVFGAEHPLSIVLIAFSAGAGALVRRGLARVSTNPFLQPLSAALLAGLIGGLAQRYQLSSPLALVALCPCMVLVPGPHFLNGLIDVIRARVSLGCSRLAFAFLVIAAISAGLLLGLRGVGATLPISPPPRSIPLPVEVLAAGFAVYAYGSFYSMQWRLLPIPIVAGMIARVLRSSAISLGASASAAALLACLLVGSVMTPLGNRLRLPFAALSFAPVVALIPGVFLFRMAGGLVQIAELGEKAPSSLAAVILGDGGTALLILVAMGFGLVAPKLFAERARPAAEVKGEAHVGAR